MSKRITQQYTEHTASLLNTAMIQRGLTCRKLSYLLKTDIRNITHSLTRNKNRGVSHENLLKIAKYLGCENPEFEAREPLKKVKPKVVNIESYSFELEPPVAPESLTSSIPEKSYEDLAYDEVWKTKDGQEILVSEMDEQHVRNALRCILRNHRMRKIANFYLPQRDMASMLYENMMEEKAYEDSF